MSYTLNQIFKANIWRPAWLDVANLTTQTHESPLTSSNTSSNYSAHLFIVVEKCRKIFDFEKTSLEMNFWNVSYFIEMCYIKHIITKLSKVTPQNFSIYSHKSYIYMYQTTGSFNISCTVEGILSFTCNLTLWDQKLCCKKNQTQIFF